MNASDRTSYRSPAGSVAVDALTKQILVVRNQLLALPRFGGEVEPATVTQGSFRPRTPYSGTTHTGCGATDSTAYNWRNRLILDDLLGRTSCHRLKSEGNWPEHNHEMTRGLGCAAASLKAQIAEVENGGDGLLGNRPDRDAKLRSGLWPLAVFGGRTGKLVCTRTTHLYDGPAGSRKVLVDTPKGTRVTAIMEVRNQHGNKWFVTDQGMWGYSGKWAKV